MKTKTSKSSDETIPTFRTEGLMAELPSRDRMRQALKVGLEGILFQIGYLADEASTNVVADGGGLDRHAGIVDCLLERASQLVRMYEALGPNPVAETE
jgi:hypothetical protein